MSRRKAAVGGGSQSARAKGLVGVLMYVSPAERRELKEGAALSGQSVREFVRAASLDAARKVLRSRGLIEKIKIVPAGEKVLD